jgi:uncharacterized membrane protein
MKGFLGFVAGLIVVSAITRPARVKAMKKALEPIIDAMNAGTE